MAVFKDREHFIPLHCGDLVELLCTERGPLAEQKVSSQDEQRFRAFASKVMTHFHREYHERLERLKIAYIPFDPDSDLRTLTPLTPEQKQQRQEDFFAEFIQLLERANYVRMTVPRWTTPCTERVTGASTWMSIGTALKKSNCSFEANTSAIAPRSTGGNGGKNSMSPYLRYSEW